ncbi:MAG TPA: hypothetical protein H9729_06715 [Candidatus Borkfalkia excrementigallinarum]|uniref:histidine kinase n=1 Tax=Candidatus Borkfalkia excrementigallinarum TaxID=2838506 RepID=A0A9D2CRR6_9FIRM|nr:hypothetical protein [Candidatus Borkfalkia excrementigallinarum]
MRKRILLVSLLVSVVGLVLLSVLFTEMYYNGAISQAEGQLKIYMQVFAEEYDGSAEAEGETERISSLLGGARVTLFSPDGSVLADTQSDTSENHAEREEVSEALEHGEGFAVRASSTLGVNMIYYCKAFPEGGETQYLVRIALPVSSEVSVFTDAIPTLLWFVLIDILVCLLIAWMATSFILRPVERLTKAAATSGGKEVQTEYSELKPIAKMMNDMNAELNERVAKMKEDRRIEKLILGSMEHGIVIFRSAEDVILINKTAAHLLDYEQNEPIRSFTEDREIADILAANEPASVYRKIEGRDYNLRFTFKEKSSVLLITDVTESMAAARSKNDFIANVTHEMNTPLTSIRGFAELIAEGGIPPERTKSVAKTIIKQSDRLSNLIRSIINFSAIDSDELPDYEVDLTELVRETISSFEPKLSQKNIALKLDIASGVKVMSRRERLLEIFNNLVSNGIRYNKEGGTLTVTLTGGEHPALAVADTGVGIAEEDKERIFDRFYTVDKSHNGGGGGFGLGLAIVKKLCKRAGWKLSVQSELGVGTEFSIQFNPPKEAK